MSPVAGLTDPTTPSVPGGSILAFEERDSCPDCGASMAADQRYCLACGHRRGDPRPPFLDAVTPIDFADAGGGPSRSLPPPPSRQGSRGRNSNAALIVGVATLILAVGLGFLVGRAAHEGSSSANHGPERIKIGGEPLAPEPRSEPHAEIAPKPNGGSGHETAESHLEVEETARRITREQLHAKVPLPKPTAKLGESCTQGTPGCGKSKKFNGVFFGAEE
jgi:hypothetical protein